MQEHIIAGLTCPGCRKKLVLSQENLVRESDEIKEGILLCGSCSKSFPIKYYIPRFVSSDNYAGSFGFQWNRYSKTQIDKFNNTNISKDRFYNVTGWPAKMNDEKILEVGSGAGRFTQIAIESGAEVFSLDFSNAIESNLQNNGLHPKIHFFQADIYHLPFQKESFDKIYCLGVLQHCPDVEKAFYSLIPFLKRDGEIVIDVYRKNWKMLFMTYYWLRPITKRLSKEILHKIVNKMVNVLLPLSNLLGKIPKIGKSIQQMLPVANYSSVYQLDKQQQLEWSILDTFDRLSPLYDNPQTIKSVKGWFENAQFEEHNVRYGINGIVGLGKKK